jgi:hypothetical protein
MHITVTLWPIAPWIWHIALGFIVGFVIGGITGAALIARMTVPTSGMF